MPRYFFHIRERDVLHDDDQGIELPDLASARNEAILAAREIMSERLREGRPPNHSRFEICDAAGRTVLVLPFSAAYSD